MGFPSKNTGVGGHSLLQGIFRTCASYVFCMAGWFSTAEPSGKPPFMCMCLATQTFLILCDTMDYSLPGSIVHGDSPDKITEVEVGCHALLQGIFPTQGSNPGLKNCRWILYHLNHKGNPRILERVAYPFSRGTYWPRNRTGISYTAGGFFTSWTTREAPFICIDLGKAT